MKKFLVTASLSLVLIVALICALTILAAGKTITVGTEGANASLVTALGQATDGDTIEVKGTLSLSTWPTNHGNRHLTFTGGTLDLTGMGATINLGGSVTFENIKINVSSGSTIYANGYKVVIGEGVTSLSQLSFKNCTKLTSVSLPSTVKEIPYNCFENCTSLLQVSGATSVEVIREDAFLRCPSLKSLTLSPALKTVEYGAFGDYSCKDGLSIYVKGSESDWTAATAQMSVGAQNEAFQNADVRFVAAD